MTESPVDTPIEAAPDEGRSVQADDTQPEATQDASASTPEDVEELRRGWLRRQDYTQKTQAHADQVRAFETERSAFYAARDASIGAPAQSPAPADEPELPDPKTDARGFIEGFIGRSVSKALADAGLSDLRQEVAPVLAQQKLGDAYRNFMRTSPKLDHASLSNEVGGIIDADDSLSELASRDPNLAVRVASQIAIARLDSQAAQQKNTSRRDVAPVAARAAGTVNGTPPSSIDEAFRQALQAQGVTPDF
jgi:hypothetical protein